MKHSYLPEIYIKKRPKQARSRMTFDAIIEACAGVLVEKGYEGVTTNHVAERAGVDISSLYEYFPNKESIVAELAERELEGLWREGAKQLADTQRYTQLGLVEHMIRWAIDWVGQREGLLSYLWIDVSFVRNLPAAESTVKVITEILQESLEQDARFRFNDIEMDIWLITRMVFGTLFEIGSMPADDPKRERLIREFIRLTYRSIFAEECPQD